MTAKAKIATAVGGSAFGHLLLLGAAVGWIAVGGAPENDDFSLRKKLGNADMVHAAGSNFAASRESGEPLHAGVLDQSGSVWWGWTAPEGIADVLIEVSLVGSEPLLAVYEGFAVDQLSTVVESNEGTVSFSPKAGSDYHFAVAGRGLDGEGVIHLHLQTFTDEDSESSVPEEEESALLLPEIVVEEEEENTNDLNYVRTTQNRREFDRPENAQFESDRNTTAASELPAELGGEENMPSQDGVDLPALEMMDRELADGNIADDATIPIAAVEIFEPMLAPDEMIETLELDQPREPNQKPEVAEEKLASAAMAEAELDDSPTADTGEFAAEFTGAEPVEAEGEMPVDDPGEADKKMAEQTPEEAVKEEKLEQEQQPEKMVEQTPQPRPTPGTERAAEEDVFQPQTRKTKVAGTISNRGSAAVDAAETPLGRYTRQVTGAVEKRWHVERRRKADFVSYGSLKVSFVVESSGKTGGLKILSNEANPIMTDFTLGAILSADIPPMPKEVRELLGREPLEITYDVIIY